MKSAAGYGRGEGVICRFVDVPIIGRNPDRRDTPTSASVPCLMICYVAYYRYYLQLLVLCDTGDARQCGRLSSIARDTAYPIGKYRHLLQFSCALIKTRSASPSISYSAPTNL